MDSDRLKALTDGVAAVILTIMVLEMKAPDGATLAALLPVAPVFLSYASASSMSPSTGTTIITSSP